MRHTRRLGLVARLAVLPALATLSGCSNAPVLPAPSEVPLSKETVALLAKKGMQPGAPVFVRIFKEESELEIWKQRDDGRYYHFKTYPICNWSGDLGPKQAQGDKQAPEGFYTITPVLMNPNSKYYLSFNLGYPNAYDRSLGHTGDSVMVHGKCRSAGCYAMTDGLVEEIYGLTRESLKAGQPYFQVQALPFRMSDAKMKEMKSHKWYPFWTVLKQGYDHFETYRIPPNVEVCEHRYVVNVDSPPGKLDPAGPCPLFHRPQIAAFTPLPTEADAAEPRLAAQGTKFKGLVSADIEPTLADVKAAKAAQKTAGGMAGAQTLGAPVAAPAVAAPASAKAP